MTDGRDEDDRDPEATLDEWKASMRAEHEDAIKNPDPDAEHRIEGVAQVSYRVTFDYDPAADALVKAGESQVDEPTEPELLSCACGVRGMTRAEARAHVAAARSDE